MIWSFKHLSRAVLLVFLPAAIFFLFSSCDFDQGLGASKTKVSGKVIFLDPASRPQNVEEVRVVAVANLPPAGFGDVYFSNAVRFDLDTASYQLSLPVGNYPAVGVLWKARGKDWAFNNLMGIYGFNPPVDFALKPVELTESQPVFDNINVYALWAFTQFDATLAGTVTFAGTWPEDTEVLLLGTFSGIPDLDNIANSLGLLGGIPLPITKPATDDNDLDYTTSVRNGSYKFIGAFWKRKGDNDPKHIRCIGFYPDPANPSRPGEVQVAPEKTAEAVNVVIDFSTLPDGVKLGSATSASGK
ncbi:MAG: hypothetical protein ACREOI_35185 [bacterium]